MAAVRRAVVRRVHDAHHWKLVESWHSYVRHRTGCARVCGPWEADGALLTGFVAFVQYKALLADADGKVSGPRTVIAGFGAGVTESLLAVTPFESIKTTL